MVRMSGKARQLECDYQNCHEKSVGTFAGAKYCKGHLKLHKLMDKYNDSLTKQRRLQDKLENMLTKM
jgi:hypothetical protein